MTNERRNMEKTGVNVIHLTKWLTFSDNTINQLGQWLTSRCIFVIQFTEWITFDIKGVYRQAKWLTSAV